MARRFTEAEKGKGALRESDQPTIKRIKAPCLDTSALIRDNSRTLIGRLTNPQVQRIWALIPSLPRQWNIQGRALGFDLGNNCFQFRFDREEDLKRVLDNRPYHFDYWMVILQRWEPIISASFPSQIPFWIKIRGLPLHYWQDRMISDIGEELGTLENHELTKTTARVRVLVDGLKPLVKETIIEFDSGEEAHITLEYERLENHCSICQRLSHKSAHCPSRRDAEMQNQQKGSSYQDIVKNQRIHTEGTKSYRERFPSTESKEKAYLPSVTQPFQARVDRHGKPFGERVSTKQTRAPPPDTSLHMEHKSSERAREHGTSVNGPLHISPQHVKSREARPQRKVNNRLSLPQKEMMQWREKYPKETHEEEVNSPAIQQITPLRAPLAIEEVQDQLHTPINQPPTREAIMDDLQEVTRQYVNCPDPIESAARRQRVLHGDAHGQMEETVDRILTAAVARYQAMFPTPPPQERAIDISTPQLLADSAPMSTEGTNTTDQPKEAQEERIPTEEETTLRRTNRRRFKPARLRSTVSSPLALQGASSKKRNFARAQRSPNRRSPVSVTAIENPQQEASQRNVAGPSNLANHPNIRLIPAIAKKKKDFHVPQHPAP